MSQVLKGVRVVEVRDPAFRDRLLQRVQSPRALDRDRLASLIPSPVRPARHLGARLVAKRSGRDSNPRAR